MTEPWPPAHTMPDPIPDRERACTDCLWIDVTKMGDAERMFLLVLRCPAHHDADPIERIPSELFGFAGAAASRSGGRSSNRAGMIHRGCDNQGAGPRT